MSAPIGNEFWKARSSHGRKPIFGSPDDLMTACLEYFEWVEANPLYETKGFAFQGVVTKETFPKMRAMSISGLCIFLDIGRRSWDEYRKREDFLPVCEAVEETIRTQKFEGASADLLNPSIIARDLGLADRSEVTGKDGGAIETKEVSDNELARRIGFMLAKGLMSAKASSGA
ncbi:terminase small subunit [Neorhizobium sp. IRAMC:178]|uniref:terminase small subunit n=1 Tax=Neorhizobium tunisiense TaxID=3144793 RepID=UPI0031F707F5